MEAVGMGLGGERKNISATHVHFGMSLPHLLFVLSIHHTVKCDPLHKLVNLIQQILIEDLLSTVHCLRP